MASRCFTLLLCPLAVALAVAAGAPLLAQTTSKIAAHLVLLDGSPLPYQSLAISDEKLSGASVPVNLKLDDLRRIELGGDISAASAHSPFIVELRSSGKIFATRIAIENEKCRLDWKGGEPLALAIDLIRAIGFDSAASNTDFEKALATPLAELDRVFIKDDAGKTSSISGLIDSLDADQLKIAVGGQEHSIPRSKLLGIIAAQPAASDPPPRCLVAFRDGSLLGGETLSLAADKAAITLPAGGKAEFSWSAALRVTIRSRRVAFLSELKPTTEEQQAIVTFPMPARRDKSVSGKPLTLGAKVYEKGLGVHSRSALTFATDKKWDLLAATIGLDAEAAGKGDCIFVILADGEALLTRRMKGTDSPEDIEVSITGREQVTLIVEPGEGLDLADHANWCDARFIKN